MGLLDRFDERNQRIADWQNHRAKGTPMRAWPDRSAFGWRFWALVIPMLVVGAIAKAMAGPWAKVGVLTVFAIACFSIVYVQQRRARERWEAEQGRR
jgi:hypothetical protein